MGILAVLVLGGLTAAGCRAAPSPAPGPQAIPFAEPITGMSAADAIYELKLALVQAQAPNIHNVHEVSPDRYRYRHQMLLVTTRDKIVYTIKIAHVSVEKVRWVFVYDHSMRHLDKIKCVDEARAWRLKALLDYICTPEFKQSYDAERAAAAPLPPPPMQPAPTQIDLAPCAICGEPRGDTIVCPHCGMQ